MQNINTKYKKSLEEAQISILKSLVYCDVIKELFIFLGQEPFSEDYLNYTLKNDIKRFIQKQYSKLNEILKQEVKKV